MRWAELWIRLSNYVRIPLTCIFNCKVNSKLRSVIYCEEFWRKKVLREMRSTFVLTGTQSDPDFVIQSHRAPSRPTNPRSRILLTNNQTVNTWWDDDWQLRMRWWKYISYKSNVNVNVDLIFKYVGLQCRELSREAEDIVKWKIFRMKW